MNDSPAFEAAAYEECGECRHYPSYCNPTGCTAWVADATPSGYCGCSGRKPPKAAERSEVREALDKVMEDPF